MKFDTKLALKWLQDSAVALPEIDQILEAASSKVLVIGAGVFDIYNLQGWMPELKRKTGDIDLSVGLVTGPEDYTVLKQEFLNRGYQNGSPPYRFHTPKQLVGALSYVDLLAHPLSASMTDQGARHLMGVGNEFSLLGMKFASNQAFQITSTIFCPNPIGMAALKIFSYRDDPNNRIKDLADIAEMASGVVQTGTHFEMKDLWRAISKEPEAKMVKEVLSELGSKESVTWDLEDARQALLNRNFSIEEIENLLPDRLMELASYLE